MALKFSEFAHIHAESIHVADVRDRVLNLLNHNKAYLVGIVPALDAPLGWANIVYVDDESIDEQLGGGTTDAALPIIAFSFGRPPIDDDIRKRSRYGRWSVIPIEVYAPGWKFRSLIDFAAVQLLAFGVLSELWGEANNRLDEHIIEDVYARDLIEWSEL